METLKQHPEFERKCPPGAILKREINNRFPNDWQLRIYEDGRPVDDISWNVALKGRGKTQKVRVSQAARLAVEPQIMDFKARNNVTSGFDADHCGEGVAELLKRFLAGREAELVEDEFHVDHLVLEAEWQAFHLQHAELQLLTPGEHKRVTRGRRAMLKH